MSDATKIHSTGRTIALLLLVGLALRLAMGAAFPVENLADDSGFYMRMGQRIADGYPFMSSRGSTPADAYYLTSVGPVYPTLLAAFFLVLPQAPALVGVRIAQALLSTLALWLTYRIGERLFGQQAGLVALAAMALDPRFILEAPDVSTETLFITLQVAGLALYLAAVHSERWRGFAWAGVVFGLATLTRPVPLLVPVALAVHALLADKQRARLLKGVGLMALALWAVVVPWVVRNAVVTGGQFIPVSDTAASAFWLGSTDSGQYHGQEEFYEARDDDIGEEDFRDKDGRYVSAGLRNILEQPVQYAGTRLRNVLAAYLQPYGTVNFPGPSVKETASKWLRGDAALGDVVQTEGFWPKLVIYGFHYAALGFGLLGLGLSWRRWREVLPLALMLAYGTAVYTVLIVLPRYLFPLVPFYWVSAGYGLLWAWARIVRREAPPHQAPSAPQPDPG